MEAKDVELLQDGFRFALSLTHNKAEAEDLVQESWLKLYEREGKIEGRTLLFTVIRNRFIDVWRKKKKITMVEYGSIPEQIAPEADPTDRMLLERVHEALDDLSPKEREVLYLQCMEEYTASEISELTGHPRGTVLSLISRGRKKLKTLLGFSEESDNSMPFQRRSV